MLLLLLSAWLACFLICREASARWRAQSDWRVAFVLAAASWGALLAIGTEALSLGTLLDVWEVRTWWLAVNAGLWSVFAYIRRRGGCAAARLPLASGWKTLQAWPVDARLMLGLSALFLIFLGVIALLTPSTNADSLSYHMARVMHWIQNRSVAHYPTNMDAQLQLGPWSEFVQTHLWLLCGNDRFANMVQWCALVGCVVVATFLTRQLLPEGTSPATAQRAEAFAVVLVATMPIAVVEAISTQTDLIAGFWLLCFATFALLWWREQDNRLYAVGAGAVIGLGTLTKFTMTLYAIPIILALAVGFIWKYARLRSRRIGVGVAQALIVSLVLAGPHLARNEGLYGSMIGSQTARMDGGISHISITGVLSNLIRNAALHSNTGIPAITHILNRTAHIVQGWTGRAANDSDLTRARAATLEPPDEFFVFDSFAACPWQVGLIGAAAILGLANWRSNQLALFAVALAFGGAVLFCALLRWQIWNSRLHLPLLLLSMPIAAALVCSRASQWWIWPSAAGLFFFAIAIVANNRSRPIFETAWRAQPRELQMLSFQLVQDYEPIREIASRIAAADCRMVGLKLEESVDCPEYAFWIMLRQAGFRGPIYHVLVEGPSGRLPGPIRPADVIISTFPGKPAGDLAQMYPTATKCGHFTVYWSAELTHRGDVSDKNRAN